MRKVYMDNNATTMTRPEAAEAMQPFHSRVYGNASSIHSFGREAKKHLEEARRKVASFIGAGSPEEIVFTSGGTESGNLAVIGAAGALAGKGKHIITSAVEHHAVLNACRHLESRGFAVTYLEVDRYGLVSPDSLRGALRDDTILVSIMAANNETGTIMPIEEIADIAAGRNILFHTDAVQAAGKIPFDAEKCGARLVSFSSHKIHGPKGVGALYIKKGTGIEPCQRGGHHEMGKRAGTENIPGIAGFAVACEIASRKMAEESERVRRLRDLLHGRIKDSVKHTRLFGHPEKRLPNTLNIGFDYLEGESIILSLDLEGIAVSTGSACTSGSLEPSHVLKAMGVEPLFSQGAVRFSLSGFNTEEDVEYAAEKLPPIIKRLRDMSPVYPGD